MKPKKQQASAEQTNFEAIYKTDFFMERRNVPSPIPSQNYHYHDCYELYYLYSGERYYFIQDTTYHVGDGAFVFIQPYDIHCTANFEGCGYDRMLINFKRDYLEEFLPLFGDVNIFECFDEAVHTAVLSPVSRQFAEKLLENMLKEYLSQNPAREKYLKIALLQLLLFLNMHRNTSEGSMLQYVNSTHKTIAEITGFINNYYYEDITLESISARFFISPCYFSRTFKKVSGLSFTQYLNNVRIKEARNLLVTTNMTITEIAIATGFRSSTHFNRVFKNITGMSPLNYKKNVLKPPNA